MITQLEPSQDAILTLPEEACKALDVKAGDKIHMEVKEGAIILSKLRTIELELDDKLLLELALMAHKQDRTLNDLIVKLLQDFLTNNTSSQEEQ